MTEIVGCARVTGAVIGNKPDSTNQVHTPDFPAPREVPMTARVGQAAPDFAAPSYYQGSFTPVKLSDFAGKWVLLCFYPGDFTFV
jgi:hypothetical protein